MSVRAKFSDRIKLPPRPGTVSCIRDIPMAGACRAVFLLWLGVSVQRTAFAEDIVETAPARTFYEIVTPREHSAIETARYVGALYVITAAGYVMINWDKIRLNGTTEYFGKAVVFDNDLPTANWGIHVFSGSQCYLFYRARSYTKTDAFLLTALQSALFEFTTEFIQEKASIEDLINTPVFGSALGAGLEVVSLPLLNSGFWPFQALGHLINLPTIFGGLYEGRVRWVPVWGEAKGLALEVKF